MRAGGSQRSVSRFIRCQVNRLTWPRALDEARRISEATGQPARVFRDFLWSTQDSWSRRRRVIGKAEWTRGEANPRFA